MGFSWAKAAVVGVVAGTVSGLLGIGGGVIVVPGLVLLVGLNQYTAAATSVATITFLTSAGLAAFAYAGSVDWLTAAVIFSGSAIGAVIGTRVLDRIPEYVLAAVFSAVMFAASIRMWL